MPVSTIIQGLFTRPSLNFLLGPLGSKKTWLALDLAISAAMGADWFGYQIIASEKEEVYGRKDRTPFPLVRGRAGDGVCLPALYIDEDTGQHEFFRRMRSVLIAHHATLYTPIHFGSGHHYDLANLHDLKSIVDLALSVTAGFIVIDMPINFDLYFTRQSIHSQNSVLANLLKFAHQLNAAVLVTLHTRKRRTNLGSALVSAGVSHVLAVDSTFDDPYIHLRTIASAGLDPISIAAKTHISRDFFDIVPTSREPISPIGAIGRRVLHHLALFGDSTSADLKTFIPRAAPTRITSVIYELNKDGYIRRVDSAGKGSAATYAITPAGRLLCAVK